MNRLRLPEKPRILVITLRRLGDVLLTTPLVRAVRESVLDATIDMLVFRGTEGMLTGNPDLTEVVTVPLSASWGDTVAMIRRLWRRYDLAISTQGGDRPTLAAVVAARQRVGLVQNDARGAWWKRVALTTPVMADPSAHRVLELLRLADCVGAERHPDLVCPQGSPNGSQVPSAPYAVLHADPMYAYKRWTESGWHALAAALTERGLTVVATGGPDPKERAYLDRLWGAARTAVTRLDGRLSWPELAALLKGAAVYVGTDTSVTHLAAGSGCPTVALFGPTSPGLIGPWPIGGLAQVWAPSGTIQHRGNVWVVQNPLPCLPCERLGCDGHLDSRAQCLDELNVRQVLAAVDAALRSRSGGEEVAPSGSAAL